jgi:polysaccharide chain length determinant protein (PEP-CTERM system associated)
MNDLLQQLVVFLRGMWHRRWVGLAAAWLAAVIGIVVVYRIPERYEASARVWVDTQTLLRPLLSGLAVQPNTAQEVAMVSRTLITRPNIQKLVRIADLDLAAKTDAERDEVIDETMRNISLGAARNNLYRIAYRDTEPERATRVVQALLTIFMESALGDKQQDTRASLKFIDDQIARYGGLLEQAEDRLKAFRLKHLGQRQGQDYFARMNELQGHIESAKMELQAQEQARDAYKRELAGEAPVFMPDPTATQPAATAASRPIAVPEIDGRLASLRSALDTLLLKYTDSHPDVLAARRLIGELEGQREQRVEELRAAAAAQQQQRADDGVPVGIGVDPARNPVFQQLRMSLAQAEANVASLRARLAGYEQRYQQLLQQAKLVPEMQQEYVQLNRDYEVQKRTYEALLARRESATMGADVQASGTTEFRIIDPARVSPRPVAPDRTFLLLIAFGAAVAVGLAFAFLASQIRPTYHDARTLRESTQRPVLGIVSTVLSPALVRARRRSVALFATSLTALFVSFAAVYAYVFLIERAA